MHLKTAIIANRSITLEEALTTQLGWLRNQRDRVRGKKGTEKGERKSGV